MQRRKWLNKVTLVSGLEVNQTGKGSGAGVHTTSMLHSMHVSLHTLRFRSVDCLVAPLHPVFGKVIHLSQHSQKDSYSLIPTGFNFMS